MVHHGAGRGREERLTNAIAEADLVVTTYQLLVRDLDTLAAVSWGTVVFDEAQAVKNAHTKAARAARHLRAGQVLALTGTPVENRLGELWSILDLTTPGLLGSQASFKSKYATPIERERDERAVVAPAGAHVAVRPAPHEGRPQPRARPPRQDRAARVGTAHP